jgi:hypothetical protein
MPVRKYTDEQLAAAVAASQNMRQVLIALGIAPFGGNYETVWRHIRILGIVATHLVAHRGRQLHMCTDEEISGAVMASRSFSGVMRTLGLRPGGNQSRLKSRIAQLELHTSHFIASAWNKGKTLPLRRPIEEVLVPGRFLTTNRWKRRLIDLGIKEPRCEMCGLDTWNEEPIPLELDHINGRRDDNRIENLRVICPNCHAQTPTYRGRNIGTADTVSS